MCCPTWARSASVSHGQFHYKVSFVLCSYLIGFGSLTRSSGSWIHIYCVFSCLRFWFRLYWFPLKVLYATCVSSIRSVPTIPFYFFFNALLFSLLLMNIYWFLVRAAQVVCPASVCPKLCDITSSLFALFPPCRVQFIVIFVVKVLKVKEVNDVREYEEEEDGKAAAGLLGESGAANKDDGAGHHIAAQGWAAPPPPPPLTSFLFNLTALIWGSALLV